MLAVRTVEVLPELAMAGDVRREPTYSVAFDSAALWGDGGEACTVVVDLWESHLEEVA